MNNNGIDQPFKLVTTSTKNGGYLRLYSPIIYDFERKVDSTVIINHPSDTIIKTFYFSDVPEGITDTIIKNNQEEKVYSHYDTLTYISLDLLGTRVCGEKCKVDIALVVNGELKNYVHTGDTHKDYKGVEIYRIRYRQSNGVCTFVDSDFYKDFINSTIIRIRVSCDYCDDQYFEFSQKGSTAAIKYIID